MGIIVKTIVTYYWVYDTLGGKVLDTEVRGRETRWTFVAKRFLNHT